MKKITLTSLLFILMLIFCQCKQNPKKENSVSAKQDSTQIQRAMTHRHKFNCFITE